MDNLVDKSDIGAGSASVSKRARQRLRDAKNAKKRYERGYTGEEIAQLMNVTPQTVWRYFGLMGGIDKHSEALHMKNRHILKLPEKDGLLKGQGAA